VELREFRTELPSTQSEAVRRAREGALEGTRVVALRQTEGRGRGGRAWASPPGNLYLSLIIRSPQSHVAMLPLAVGASLRSAIARRYAVRTALKWPNDLLVLGPGPSRKLSGVVSDQVASPTLGAAAIVGVGVNVAAPAEAYPAEIRKRVVGLAELVEPAPAVDEVEELAVHSVESAAASLRSDSGVTEILEECRAALHGVGHRARVDSTLSGVIRGLGDEGELWLETPGGARAVCAGTLVVEEDS
jgi:BirA family transcriptional regulator, biotin operon repressor / biotin---[acetyl-CoA-carboxylase] ligase